MAKLLVDGSQFKDTWTLTTVNDDVHISAYTFQAIGFLENYQVRTPSREGPPRREGTRRRTSLQYPRRPHRTSTSTNTHTHTHIHTPCHPLPSSPRRHSS
jgi:hypothetical protein